MTRDHRRVLAEESWVIGQEGDQRDRAGGKRCRRCGHGPADDRADGDSDREVERAELGKRAPLSKAQADDGHCEYQDSLDHHPAETARPADQFQQPHHSYWACCLPACLPGQVCVQVSPVSFLLNAFAVPLPPDAAPMRAES